MKKKGIIANSIEREKLKREQKRKRKNKRGKKEK